MLGQSVERYWKQKGRAEAEECMRVHAKTQIVDDDDDNNADNNVVKKRSDTMCRKNFWNHTKMRRQNWRGLHCLYGISEDHLIVWTCRMYEKEVLSSYQLKKNLHALKQQLSTNSSRVSSSHLSSSSEK
eukprot:765357-Hanusia_phi.AAC.3